MATEAINYAGEKVHDGNESKVQERRRTRTYSFGRLPKPPVKEFTPDHFNVEMENSIDEGLLTKMLI